MPYWLAILLDFILSIGIVGAMGYVVIQGVP